jgi:hypothetical protein
MPSLRLASLCGPRCKLGAFRAAPRRRVSVMRPLYPRTAGGNGGPSRGGTAPAAGAPASTPRTPSDAAAIEALTRLRGGVEIRVPPWH